MRPVAGNSGQLVEACLGCTLPICNKAASGCNYTITLKRWNGEDYQARREYHAEYYRQNRDRKLAAAKQRRLEFEECQTGR